MARRRATASGWPGSSISSTPILLSSCCTFFVPASWVAISGHLTARDLSSSKRASQFCRGKRTKEILLYFTLADLCRASVRCQVSCFLFSLSLSPRVTTTSLGDRCGFFQYVGFLPSGSSQFSTMVRDY